MKEENQVNSELNNNNNKKSYYKGYMIIFIVVMILLRFVAELGSNIPTFIQSSIINEFFVSKGMSYDDGLSIFTSVNLAVSSVYVLSFLYKPLSDKIGRRRIIIINVIGILIGFFLFSNAVNFLIYSIGNAFILFFIQNDTQMVYILETTNSKNNGKVFGIIKSIGILGLLFVPFLREFAMKNDDSLWRNVFIVPIILTIVVLLCMLIFLRESNTFKNKSKDVEIDQKSEKINLKESIKYILKKKDLRLATIAYVFYGLCSMPAYMYVESIMTTNGMSTENVTKALYVYPIVYAVLALLGGIFADKIGRKKIVVTSGFLAGIGFILFIICIIKGVNPYVIGFLNGIYLGSYWVMGDYISFMFVENVSTNVRQQVLTASGILMMLGMVLGIAIELLLIKLVGLTIASIIIIVPCSITSAIIILLKVKDTLGRNLENIKMEK